MANADDLLQAIREGGLERVRGLLAAQPGLASARDPEGVSALMHARYRQRFDIAQAILEWRGGEIDVFEAAALGQFGPLERLLARDPVQVGARSPDGFTALHFAAFFAEAACVRVLLQRGADVEAVARNPLAVRPLHSAVAGGSLEIVEMLLAGGADPKSRHRGGQTPLHAAAFSGRADLAHVLLARGAESGVPNEDGITPLELARSRGHAAVVQALLAGSGAGA